jgi:hypothetical protein
MAIAIHTIKEVTRLDYNYRDYNHFKWVNYVAWKVLRYSPKFHPPSLASTMNHENDNTTGTSPPTINPVLISESPFPPESATTNTAILEMNKNPSPETVAATSAAVATVAALSAAAADGGDNNLSLKCAFVPVDPALGGRGAEMGIALDRI